MSESLAARTEYVAPIPDKPDQVTEELLTLKGKTGSQELAYLHGLLKHWYGLTPADIFAQQPNSIVFDERTLIKIFVLLREGWTLLRIADALDPPHPHRPQDITPERLGRVRKQMFVASHLGENGPKEKGAFSAQERSRIAQSFIRDRSFKGMATEAHGEKQIQQHVRLVGRRFLEYVHREDPLWTPYRNVLTPLGAYLIVYGGIDPSDAAVIAQEEKKRNAQELWSVARKQKLARLLQEESLTGPAIAQQLDATVNAMYGIIAREGNKEIAERTDDPVWKAHTITPMAAFLAVYGKMHIQKAITLARARLTSRQ